MLPTKKTIKELYKKYSPEINKGITKFINKNIYEDILRINNYENKKKIPITKFDLNISEKISLALVKFKILFINNKRLFIASTMLIYLMILLYILKNKLLRLVVNQGNQVNVQPVVQPVVHPDIELEQYLHAIFTLGPNSREVFMTIIPAVRNAVGIEFFDNPDNREKFQRLMTTNVRIHKILSNEIQENIRRFQQNNLSKAAIKRLYNQVLDVTHKQYNIGPDVIRKILSFIRKY